MLLFGCVVLWSVLLSSRRVRAALPGESLSATALAALTMFALLLTGQLS